MTRGQQKPEMVLEGKQVMDLYALMKHPRKCLYYVPKKVRGKDVLEVYLID